MAPAILSRFPEQCVFSRQVIFDETLQKCLDSYLSHTPRKFDTVADLPPEVNDLQRHLHRSVFLTFLRMSTHKESKVNTASSALCAFELCASPPSQGKK